MKNRSIDSENLFTYVKSLFAGAKKEMLYMICVSKGGRITKTHLVTRGAGDFVSIDQREIVKTALNNDAWGIIFAHNHPTGIATPSNDDIETTKMLNRCLAFMNISLIEHYIVAGDKCVSIVNDKRYKLMK